ncbi:hypothetical protein [Belnapia sp. F-4-1]|uniref:hypothetical protein n=1 Tax=Belnapia sp. F-4-1 TaxID=1545443 RepID=UPI0005BA01A1|nr:hypothetical protein [Belnapia sp. F-4-1]
MNAEATRPAPTDPWSANVLQAPGARLCKIIRPGADPVPAQLPLRYDMHPAAVRTLGELEGLLARLAAARDCCIVRAAPADPARVLMVRRLLHHDPETGEVPTLRDVQRALVALDLDGAALPVGCDPRDLAACHAVVAPTLPAEMRGAGCVVQATGSHGIKPGIRVRLWFLLDRPCWGADLAAWLAEVPGLDPTCFRPVQVIFTAAPIFADGAVDPLPSRLLAVPGPAAAPPSLEKYRRPPPPPPGAVMRRWGNGGQEKTVARFAALLRTVAGAAEGTRHCTLYWAACRAGELVMAGELVRAAAADALADAAMQGGGKDAVNARKTASAGIARGMVECA